MAMQKLYLKRALQKGTDITSTSGKTLEAPMTSDSGKALQAPCKRESEITSDSGKTLEPPCRRESHTSHPTRARHSIFLAEGSQKTLLPARTYTFEPKEIEVTL